MRRHRQVERRLSVAVYAASDRDIGRNTIMFVPDDCYVSIAGLGVALR
jgi:hypothetical protein